MAAAVARRGPKPSGKVTRTVSVRVDAALFEQAFYGLRYKTQVELIEAGLLALLAAPPAAIVYPAESKRMPRMSRGTARARRELERREAFEKQLQAEGGGFVDHFTGEVVRAKSSEDLPPGFTTNPDDLIHQPKRRPPQGGRVWTDNRALRLARTRGVTREPPYTAYHYASREYDETLKDDAGTQRRFITPDAASDALWEEYARPMRGHEGQEDFTYLHESDWHTLRGASPEEVLGHE